MVSLAHGAAFPEELDSVFSARPHAPAHLKFGYLFDLKAAKHRLIESPETLVALHQLGETMCTIKSDDGKFSDIPSGYAYFGQFVAHDITLFNLHMRSDSKFASCDFEQALDPAALTLMAARFVNKRGAQLQLDSVYNDAVLEDDGIHMKLGTVTPAEHNLDKRIRTLDPFRDVPRSAGDRSALIGDPRNDNNAIVSQLHVAFLRAHNTIVDILLEKNVDRAGVFGEAQKILRQHYHHVLIHDYLKLVAEEEIVNEILERADPLCNPDADDFCLPHEFTVAAFRFGHSLISSTYYYNSNLPGVSFSNLIPLLFMDFYDPNKATLPNTRIIEWERFVTRRNTGTIDNPNFTRLIIPALVKPTFNVLDANGEPIKCLTKLAVLDLLRGYMVRLPTGQAVAEELNALGRKIRVLTAKEIEDNAAKRSATQKAIMTDPRFDFCNRTPLWFYILTEAELIHGGQKLGPVGSTIVAEVLIALVRRSPDPILPKAGVNPNETNFAPLPTESGAFTLADILRLGKVMPSILNPDQ
jgi:hypothetical protein